MATLWPQETVWPTEHREHATHLTKYLRDTPKCFDRSQNQPVPVDLVKLIVNGTIPLIAKFQRIPDSSSICGSLQVMQTEANAPGKETTQALRKIKEDVSNNTLKMQKNMESAEEVKALAREAVEITVNIREPLTIQSLRAMNPRNLNAHVERAIVNSGNEQIMSIKVMSSNQLKSGDLSIRLDGEDTTYSQLAGSTNTTAEGQHEHGSRGFGPNRLQRFGFKQEVDAK
ncbi:hypothetical protein LTR62_001943 [Meristemomyces frigidus]|uniref:Uncharacterized protein n=1 Tax=Meristemomyces frigidus TaxID=1508187 RepID=A0AAN7YFZ7_9PEZI|nr:hypothetical protein LTR62_001943 [Meristemomyces frigidus]